MGLLSWLRSRQERKIQRLRAKAPKVGEVVMFQTYSGGSSDESVVLAYSPDFRLIQVVELRYFSKWREYNVFVNFASWHDLHLRHIKRTGSYVEVPGFGYVVPPELAVEVEKLAKTFGPVGAVEVMRKINLTC